jgi:hypothetical protein
MCVSTALYFRPRHCMEVNGLLRAPGAPITGKDTPLFTGQEGVWTPEPIWTRWRKDKSLHLSGT